MKLLVCLITFNRLDYTQRTLRNFRKTISDDTVYYLVAVDNASHDSTQIYLKNQERSGVIDKVILNPENYYPGKAVNIGWEAGLEEFPQAEYMMRLDNDMELKKGWDHSVLEYFRSIPELGQLGYDHEAIEHPQADQWRKTINGKTLNEWPYKVVGGPCVIRRKVWNDGNRYSEAAWTNHGDENTIAEQEDVKFSRQLQTDGWLVGHTQEDIGRTFANKDNWHEYPDYYKETMQIRGYKREYGFLWEDEKPKTN
jgi:glycosyltransferase involved in cell wall biosynthesis